MSDWTIEQELQFLSKTISVEDAVEALFLLPSDEIFSHISHESNWIRGGSETYHYSFIIETKKGKLHKFLLKACVTFNGGQNINSTVAKWLERRKLLENSGVNTPTLYASSAGLILEEFIQYPITSIHINDAILFELVNLSGVLTRQGFTPIEGFFSDLRSHLSDVVVVDFGEDLGHFGCSSQNSSTLLSMLLKQLSKWKIEINSEKIIELKDFYYNIIYP